MSPETEELYATYVKYIKDDLFLLPFGGHGIGHTQRVLQLALMIASSHTLTASEIKTLASLVAIMTLVEIENVLMMSMELNLLKSF